MASDFKTTVMDIFMQGTSTMRDNNQELRSVPYNRQTALLCRQNGQAIQSLSKDLQSTVYLKVVASE